MGDASHTFIRCDRSEKEILFDFSQLNHEVEGSKTALR